MAKKGLLLCVCQGTCPSFHEMDIFEVGNALRREKIVDYVAVHPQLCAKDGDVFLETLLGGDSTAELYVAACDPLMQAKMFRDAMDKVGFDREKLHGVDIRNMKTEEAVAAITKLVSGEKIQNWITSRLAKEQDNLLNGRTTMKIALTVKGAGLGAWIDDDFAHCGYVMLVDDDNKFDAWANPYRNRASNQSEELIEDVLREEPDTLITGQISNSIKNVLIAHGIRVIDDQKGSALELIEKERAQDFQNLPK